MQNTLIRKNQYWKKTPKLSRIRNTFQNHFFQGAFPGFPGKGVFFQLFQVMNEPCYRCRHSEMFYKIGASEFHNYYFGNVQRKLIFWFNYLGQNPWLYSYDFFCRYILVTDLYFYSNYFWEHLQLANSMQRDI